MRTTVHSSIKETPFERHYGRKPRTEVHNYLNISPKKHYAVSEKPETLQFYSFANKNGQHDQLVMNAPRKLKEDVRNKFLYLFLEKKRTKIKFDSAYEREPQIAISGTKHTILTNENEVIHRKRASKPTNPLFQNPLSRRGENPRGIEGRFIQIESIDTEHTERSSTPILEENVLDNTLEMTKTTISPVYGRGKRKLIRDRTNETTPGKSDRTIAPTTEDDPNKITVVDQNGNTDLIKIEMIEISI